MKNKLILIVIIICASVLRLINLGSYPSGLNADEAALAYNAYSLIQTGKDEHGHPWPVNLESFGDFKPAGYTYILIPFIKMLGVNEFATRLPSALLGILAVFLIYKLAQKTTGYELLAAAVLAFSPWHIHFSRGGWEVNVATTLLLASVVLFLHYKDKKSLWSLLTSGLALLGSMYVYQSTRLIAPLLGLGMVVFYWSALKSNFKNVLIASFVLLICTVPLGISVLTSDASSRLSGVGLFADIGPINRANQLRGQHNNWTGLSSRLLHNKPVVYTFQFISNYIDHFDGDFLFVNGDKIERNKIPETGLLYFTDALFACIGLVVLLKNRSKNSLFILFWLLIAPVAAALTFQTPHSLRAHNMVVPLSLIVAMGIGTVLKIVKQKLPIVAIIIFGIYVWQISRYLHEYYVHYPQTYPAAWEYGFKDLVGYVDSVKDQYDQIIVTDHYDQPYILFLFYSKYPPYKFQTNHTLTFRDRFNFSTVRSYDKFKFTSIKWNEVKDMKNTLVVGTSEEIPEAVTTVNIINFPNNRPAFKIVSLK